jgi:hemolysin III
VKVRDPISGFSHLGGLVLSLAGAGYLLARSTRDVGTFVTSATYGVCLVALYLASSAYHLVLAGETVTRRLRLLDHIAIFLMVAGSCTPILYGGLAGAARAAMIAGVWSVAAAGIVLQVVWRGAPRWLYTAFYVAMGWGVALQWPRMMATLPGAALVLVVAGGVTYTLGAIVYAVKRPDPLPLVFGFHEIWHVFVLGGSALHYAAIVSLAGAR